MLMTKSIRLISKKYAVKNGCEKGIGIFWWSLKQSHGFSHDIDCKNSQLLEGSLYLHSRIQMVFAEPGCYLPLKIWQKWSDFVTKNSLLNAEEGFISSISSPAGCKFLGNGWNWGASVRFKTKAARVQGVRSPASLWRLRVLLFQWLSSGGIPAPSAFSREKHAGAAVSPTAKSLK